MSGIVDQLDQLALETIAGWEATCRRLWAQACAHDQIDPGAPFVVFSEENPYSHYFYAAQRNLLEARAVRSSYGYVGLTITRGRATRPPRKRRQP